MKNIFDVKIHYHDGSKDIYTIVSSNDVVARETAIKLSAKEFKENGFQQPKIDFCEIEFIADNAYIA